MTEYQPERPWEDDEPAESETSDRKATTGCLGWGALIVLAALAWGFLTSSDEDGDEPSLEVIHYDVERVCEEFVEERLKAPSTAEFEATVSGTGPEYTAAGTVDSENSFGAMVRNDYSCTVRDSGDTWTLVELTGLEQ